VCHLWTSHLALALGVLSENLLLSATVFLELVALPLGCLALRCLVGRKGSVSWIHSIHAATHRVVVFEKVFHTAVSWFQHR
jgi:hypothetical protein